MIERQELWCHDCGNYVQFDLDIEINGNHVLECPVCGHEHCRVVEEGKITEERWDSRNGPTIIVSSTTMNTTSTSTWQTYSTSTSTATTSGTDSSIYLYDSWLNTGN